MGLRLVTPPEVEPVTLDDAKAHLRLDSETEDGYVSALITAARERVELFLRRALVTQEFELTLDGFPAGAVIDLPRPPLQSVESIGYVDMGGDTQTLPPEFYVVDASSQEIGRVALAWNCSWPATRPSISSVVVGYTAGYGDEAASVPQAIRHAILIEIASLYEHRESVVVGQAVNMLPVSESLLWPYRALGVE